MSLPYLKSLKKPDLLSIAEETDLPDYNDFNKTDLVILLEKHLRENRSIFNNLQSLAEYYSRLDSPPRRGSPLKRDTTRTPARRARKMEEVKQEESSEEAEEPEPSPEVVSPTPAASRTNTRQTRRQSLRQSISAIADAEPTLPASPAIITEAIDAQTVKLRETIDHVWTASGLVERAHSLRATLSNMKAVEILVLLLESASLAKELVPIRYLTTTPPVQGAQIPPIPIRVPDLFVVLEGAFWAPFSLWFLTCLLLPLVSAYFINLSWQASSGRRTRSASRLAQFDPLTFNIVKALLVNVVFVSGSNFGGVYSKFAVRKVVDSVPGGVSGLLTGTAIGGVGALYEAILHRS
ncbi:uncharacterized protein N7515_000266 [Penicillium bovifimosum]|uniref:Uncharacterized protein n=1 Tax=Penicillium bovifimosum TaxID=126998 RepID=A0A9W9HF27_9EURO|nr:uncharacterized protein N7515_000266 [Penicillium bovifimosum]KAJ5145702.1 hypothetical protein N7515_000266 [Penicillium bovifimosum]